MSKTVAGDVIVLVLVSAAALSTGWVLRDARARGLPRRKALTWAVLQRERLVFNWSSQLLQ